MIKALKENLLVTVTAMDFLSAKGAVVFSGHPILIPITEPMMVGLGNYVPVQMPLTRYISQRKPGLPLGALKTGKRFTG